MSMNFHPCVERRDDRNIEELPQTRRNVNNFKTYCMLNKGFILLYFPGFKETITFINAFFSLGSIAVTVERQ